MYSVNVFTYLYEYTAEKTEKRPSAKVTRPRAAEVKKLIVEETERRCPWETMAAARQQHSNDLQDRISSLKAERDEAEKYAKESKALLNKALTEVAELNKELKFSQSEQDRLRDSRSQVAHDVDGKAQKEVMAKYAARLGEVCTYILAHDHFDQVALKAYRTRC